MLKGAKALIKRMVKPSLKSTVSLAREMGDQQLFQINELTLQNIAVNKLNVGCGTDYRHGFVNIDGSNTLPKVDKVIDISSESLLNHFPASSIDYILANDIVEHHYHWEAVNIMTEFYKLLKTGGMCEIRVPDCDHIIVSNQYSPERKLTLLFGGQDVPQGIDSDMDESRKKFPQYFCHKYGWSMSRMNNDLVKIGFQNIAMKGADSNFIVVAKK